eukprot:Gb_11128 [translate_table: standard]
MIQSISDGLVESRENLDTIRLNCQQLEKLFKEKQIQYIEEEKEDLPIKEPEYPKTQGRDAQERITKDQTCKPMEDYQEGNMFDSALEVEGNTDAMLKHNVRVNLPKMVGSFEKILIFRFDGEIQPCEWMKKSKEALSTHKWKERSWPLTLISFEQEFYKEEDQPWNMCCNIPKFNFGGPIKEEAKEKNEDEKHIVEENKVEKAPDSEEYDNRLFEDEQKEEEDAAEASTGCK